MRNSPIHPPARLSAADDNRIYYNIPIPIVQEEIYSQMLRICMKNALTPTLSVKNELKPN